MIALQLKFFELAKKVKLYFYKVMVNSFYFCSEKSVKTQRGSNLGFPRDRPTLYVLSYQLNHTDSPKVSVFQMQNLILQSFAKYCKILQIYFYYQLWIPKILRKYFKGLFHQIIVAAPTSIKPSTDGNDPVFTAIEQK